MTSQINPNNIDGLYPTAGVSNNTQGMRDNFTNIKQNFQYAENEIDDLQSKVLLKAALTGTTLDNNMNDNLLYAVKLQDVSYTAVRLAASSGSVTLDYSAGQVQTMESVTGNVSLDFSNWPASGSYGELRFEITVSNTAYTLTIPSSVKYGLIAIDGISPGTAGVSNTITFAATGVYVFSFTTIDAGADITIESLVRPSNTYSNPINITNTTPSTSTTTGALIVAGGVGIGANINVGGNLKTYTSSGNVAFSALDTGFVQLNVPTVAGNTAGALNIVGSTNGNYQPIYNAGGMLHITGNDGLSARVSVDTFGTGVQSAFVQRLARGTAAAPTAVQASDILARITGTGYGTTGYTLAAGNIGTLGIDFVALETFSDTVAGSALKFYTSPIGAVTKTLSANITANVTTFGNAVSVTGNVIGGNITTAGLITATGNITGGNVNTVALSLTGNVLSSLNVTGNITGANVTTTGLMSTTGNVNGGNIIASALITCVGNVTSGNVNTSGLISATGNIISTGNIVLNDGGTMGYVAGAGGTISQTGNKSGNVTLNKPTGEITMQNSNLASDTTVDFYLTNSTITTHDLLIINQTSTANAGGYVFNAICNTGNAHIFVRNVMAATAGDAIVLRYAVVRGAVA